MSYNKISGFADEISSKIITQFTVLNKLGIKYFEPRGINDKNISELNDDEALDLKAKMIDYAKAEDVVLLHENEKDIYGDTIDRCLDLMLELHCDNFMVYGRMK